MANLDAIYTASNCHIAYQLNWSLSLFPTSPLPPASEWLEPLRQSTEGDCVRILEGRELKPSVLQFFASAQPHVAPAQVVRAIKGRLQYLVRRRLPRAFRRNYRIESVGEVNNRVLQAYVARQPERHPMPDASLQQMLSSLQIHDPEVSLAKVRCSAHGQFLHNLHIVLENADRLHDLRERALRATRDMIVRACAKKGLLLSRAGIVSNHVHLLLGCDVSDAPRDVALSFLNNLAYAHGMKRMYEFGFYVGTFGNYDRDAIRDRIVAGQSASHRGKPDGDGAARGGVR